MTSDVVGATTATRRRALLLLVAACLGCALTARLAWWQWSRGQQKEALQAALDERGREPALSLADIARDPVAVEAQQYRAVRLHGRWRPQDTVFLDNRPMDGRTGFYVVTPLELAPGDAVAVQRGWVPRNFEDRSALPSLPLPSGEVTLVGRITPPPGRLYDFGGEAGGLIRQNLDLPSYAREVGVPMRPWSVQQADVPGAAPDGLRRAWPAPALDVSKHYGYAFQWAAMSALIAGLYVGFQVVRPAFRRRGTR